MRTHLLTVVRKDHNTTNVVKQRKHTYTKKKWHFCITVYYNCYEYDCPLKCSFVAAAVVAVVSALSDFG